MVFYYSEETFPDIKLKHFTGSVTLLTLGVYVWESKVPVSTVRLLTLDTQPA